MTIITNSLVSVFVLYTTKTIGGYISTNAGYSAEAINDDVDWIAVALWNETLMVFVDAGINYGDKNRENEGFEGWEFFTINTAEIVYECGAKQGIN